MIRGIRRGLAAACVVVSAAGAAGFGQEPILTFELAEARITVVQGGTAVASLRVDNPSVYTGEDVEPIVEIDGITVRAEPEEIEALGPFQSATIALFLTAAEGLQLGSSSEAIEILYSYCIGELCFQFSEAIPFELTVEPAPEGPIEPPPAAPAEPRSWFWIRVGGLGFGLLLVIAAIAIRRMLSTTWPVYVALLVLVVGGLAYGVVLNQHEQAQGIAAVLCTSCVGIEEAQHGEPRLSPEGIAAFAAIETDVELIVFYAEWCHACPYAEAMVESVAALNPRIAYRFVDVAQQPELAASSGVVQSGRTVVPAILRVDTGRVVFGAEDLEARLLDLLGRGS